MIDFAFTAEQEDFRKELRRFAVTELAPNYRERAARSEFCWTAHRQLAELGVLGLGLPEKFGGTGEPDPITLGLATEALAYGDVNVAAAPVQVGLVAAQLAHQARDAVAARYVPALIRGEIVAAIAVTEPSAGSDAARLAARVRPVPGGWRLSGEKIAITHATSAAVALVYARQPGSQGHRGISCFAVDLQAEGVTRSPMPGMGALPLCWGGLAFDEVFVPADHLVGTEGRGFTGAMHHFDFSRPALGLLCLGAAQASPDGGGAVAVLPGAVAAGDRPAAHRSGRHVQVVAAAGRQGDHRDRLGYARQPRLLRRVPAATAVPRRGQLPGRRRDRRDPEADHRHVPARQGRHPVMASPVIASTVKVGISVHDSLMIADPARRRALLSVIEQAGLDYVEFFQLSSARIKPAPDPPVPIVIGGKDEAAVRRAARYGDGWLAIFCSARRFAQTKEQIAEAAAALGRPAPPWYGINVWCGLDADAAQARQLLASQLEGLYPLPFGKFERLTPAGTTAQVAEALAPYRAAGAEYITLVPAAASPEAGVEHAAAVRAMLE